jgi:uncharacterized iron-regulated membrane protein
MTVVFLVVGGYAVLVSVLVGWFAWWCRKPLKPRKGDSK